MDLFSFSAQADSATALGRFSCKEEEPQFFDAIINCDCDILWSKYNRIKVPNPFYNLPLVPSSSAAGFGEKHLTTTQL